MNFRNLFSCLFFLLLSTTNVHARLYAVLVGVSEYKQSEDNLTYSHSDAIEMYEMLNLQTSANHLKLLTNQQATRNNIISVAQALFSQAEADDIVIFFFSGHGNKGCFMAHDRPLYFNALKDIFKQTKAKRKMIFADACLVGTLRASNNNSSNSHRSVGADVLLFLSSRSNQDSQELHSLKNGLFTYFLLAGLKGAADTNKDRAITARELFDFVNPKVKEKSEGSQVPVMWGKFDENMVILRWEKRDE
jgi:uncharacterized caspase-like protein